MPTNLKQFLLLSFLLISFQLSAQSGKVVYVTDGDTFHMMINGQKEKIRMADIDTPETTQPYGLEAKEHLINLIRGKTVEIKVRNTDYYGRKVAFVYLNGQDINKKMVEDGYAWWYEKYGPNNTTYKKAQQIAKANKKGLWSESNPVAPWDWRRNN